MRLPLPSHTRNAPQGLPPSQTSIRFFLVPFRDAFLFPSVIPSSPHSAYPPLAHPPGQPALGLALLWVVLHSPPWEEQETPPENRLHKWSQSLGLLTPGIGKRIGILASFSLKLGTWKEIPLLFPKAQSLSYLPPTGISSFWM